LPSGAAGRAIIPAMTEEDDDIEDPPEPTGPYHVGLWGEAQHWVAQLVRVWGNVREIALIGISRRSALRCRTWLWSIEGIVRRLILAAALRFDLSSLKPRAASKRKAAPAKPEPEPSTEPKRPSSVFRLLAATGRTGARPAPPPRPQDTGHRHLTQPADTLLRIGAAQTPQLKPRRTPTAYRPHPLDRVGRISRWDPLYRSDPEAEAASYRRCFFGPFKTYGEFDPQPPKRERRRRDIHDPYYRGEDSMLEHRRIAEEWERQIPAPSLAGRIMALHRVMQDPEPWIKRAARLLHRAPSLVPRLSDATSPSFRRHRRYDGPEPPGLAPLWLAHDRMRGIDTS
jgi:hypothetical protein